MSKPFISDDTRFAKMQPDGTIVVIEVSTGKTLEKTDLITMKPIKNAVLVWEYSWIMAQVICQKIREGGLLTEICKTSGFPDITTVNRWERTSEEFEGLLTLACRDRAEFYRDQVIKAAEVAEVRGGGPDSLLLVNAYKWAAEKDNPDKFGLRTKITGDKNAPIAIIVDTGIRRETDIERKSDENTETDTPEILNDANQGEENDKNN